MGCGSGITMKRFLPLFVAVHLFLLQAQVPAWTATLGWLLLLSSFVFPKLREKYPRYTTGFWIEFAAGLCASVILWKVRPIWGVESSTALIYLFLPLELCRLQDRRSQWRFLFIVLTALALILLDFTGWLSTLFLLADLVVIFQLMIVFEGAKAELSWAGFRSALTLILMSLPLWVCIFIFFPRFTLELWGTQTQQSELGFSDSLEPGNVEKVVQNSEVAFRFRWRGKNPPGVFYYFRGAALEEGEGLSWHLDPKSASSLQSDPPATFDTTFEQEIWGHPRNGRTLFALDRAVSMEVQGEQIEAFPTALFRLKRVPRVPFFYRARSSIAQAPHPLAKHEQERLTKVSEALKEQLQNWWNQHGSWQELKKASTQEKIRMIRSQYRELGFRYSLNPPKLQTKGVIEFLQQTRNGFCEHYAAATATLLRAAEVPARTVVGFLGGRPDLFTADWVVMTREAHAWVEYYDDQQKDWLRLDPTLWIEPLRGEMGADVYWLPQELRDQFALSGERLLPWWPQFKERTKLAWEASFGNAERLALTYDTSWMKNMLAPVGAEKWSDTFSFIFLLGGVGIMMAFIPWLRAFLRERSGWEKIWRQFKKRTGQNFESGTEQGELSEWRAWLASAETQKNSSALTADFKTTSQEFVNLYVQFRYQDPSSKLTRKKRVKLDRLMRMIPKQKGLIRLVKRLILPRRSSDHDSRRPQKMDTR